MSAWDDFSKEIDEFFENAACVPKGKSVWLGIPLIKKLAKAAGDPEWEYIDKSTLSEEKILDWINTCIMRMNDYYALEKLYNSDMDNEYYALEQLYDSAMDNEDVGRG